jgi:hypothetical protein
MNGPLQLRQVFTPGGLPSVTYVGRDHLHLEKALADSLQGYGFVTVTGPTKSGKSVLCTRVLQQGIVTIEGGQIRAEADFWNHIAYKLDIASGSSTNEAVTSTTAAAGETSGGLPAILQAKGSVTRTRSDQSGSTLSFTNIPMLAAVEKLLQTGSTLMVDDFHYINPDLQKVLVRSLKGPVFKGLPVLLIAVPHRAFDTLMVENEVEGRFRHVPIPTWSLDDLVLIPERGFAALNVLVPRAIQRRICEESFGNPLLVQEICNGLCAVNDVTEAQQTLKYLDISILETVYRRMAENKGLPIYQKISRGPEGRKARRTRKVRGGGEVDLYTGILSAVARLGPKTTTTLDDMRGSLREVFSDDSPVPAKAEVVGCLKNMSKLAKQMPGEPSLEWVEDTQRLEITDPFLLFSLKWNK